MKWRASSSCVLNKSSIEVNTTKKGKQKSEGRAGWHSSVRVHSSPVVWLWRVQLLAYQECYTKSGSTCFTESSPIKLHCKISLSHLVTRLHQIRVRTSAPEWTRDIQHNLATQDAFQTRSSPLRDSNNKSKWYCERLKLIPADSVALRSEVESFSE